MRKSYIFELLIVSLAFAVSCDRNETPLEEPCDLIQIAASGEDMQTRGLLNMADLPTEGTKVKIYDYLTGFSGVIDGQEYTNGNVMYIDDEVECVTAGNTAAPKGSWKFDTAPWRWTRTGTHHFFGWLTYDKKSNLKVTNLVTPNFADNTLTVPAITFTKDTPQFDFSYSDIVTKETPKATPSDVEIPLKHLFTALAVTVRNEANDAVTISSISLRGIVNGRSATVDYNLGTSDTRNAELTTGTAGNFDVWSGTTPISIAAETATPVNAYTNQPLTLTEGKVTLANTDFRLLWPQDDLTNAKITVKYKIGSAKEIDKTVDLKDDTFKMMEAGKKYILNIAITYTALYVNPIIANWVDVSELDYTLGMTTSMRLFDSWLYRYDTDKNYDDWKNNWEGSHMAVSSGRVVTPVAPETVAGRPLRSPQIQLVTSGAYTYDLVVDNSDFEIVQAVKDATTGKVTEYKASTNGKLTIAVGNDINTYFYIVPKNGVTPSNPVAKVSLIYNDSVNGAQKVTFNNNTLPGYSDDSSEIWAYYVPESEYNITDKLKMYFQDYNHPLVPTTDQN